MATQTEIARESHQLFLLTREGFDAYYVNLVDGEKYSLLDERYGLSKIISMGLKKIGKSQTWLANKCGVSKFSMWAYTHGEDVPKSDVLKKIFLSLKAPYEPLSNLNNLDDVIENEKI